MLSVNARLLTFECLNQSMKLGMCIIAPEPILAAYFVKPSHQSVVCLSLPSLLGNGSVKCIPPFVARQRLGKHVSAAPNTRNNRTVGLVYLWVSLCIPLSLRGNNSVKTFPRQRRIFGGVVFYAFRVV
jgi:hypothetical protein